MTKQIQLDVIIELWTAEQTTVHLRTPAPSILPLSPTIISHFSNKFFSFHTFSYILGFLVSCVIQLRNGVNGSEIHFIIRILILNNFWSDNLNPINDIYIDSQHLRKLQEHACRLSLCSQKKNGKKATHLVLLSRIQTR